MKSRLVILLQILVIVVAGYAMPPYPGYVEQMRTHLAEPTYYLQHETALRAAGVDAPSDERFDRSIDELNTNRFLLVLLVDFSDQPSRVAASAFDGLYFTNSNSVNAYFNAVSRNTCNFTTSNLPSAMGWLRMPQTYEYYVNSSNGFGSYPRNAQKLFEDAISAAVSRINFSTYDNNHDNRCDGVILVHSGPGAEFTGDNTDIWSHAWAVSPQTLNGVTVSNYCTVPEYWINSGDMTIGVSCHEMGHNQFALPDLYDTDYSSQGIGDWSLMASGSWNGPLGNSPAFPDAWSRVSMGFASATTISTSIPSATILPSETASSFYKIAANPSTTEYYLLENRQLTSFDAALPASGLLIWHIDESIGNNNNEYYTGHTTGHYHVALEQADGLNHLERNQNNGDAADPFPGSTTNRRFAPSTTPSSLRYGGLTTTPPIDISNISVSGSNITAAISLAQLPNIAVLAPNGGESWAVGSSQTIRWTSYQVTGLLNIYLKRSPTETWVRIGPNVSNTGSFRWTVTGPATSTAKILVQNAAATIKDSSQTVFSIYVPPSITITAPNTAESWQLGTIKTITWNSVNVSGTVSIQLNRSYPTGSWETLYAGVTNNSSHTWTVTGTTSSTSRFRILSDATPTVGDTTNASLYICNLSLSAPDGGQSWGIGSRQTISWTNANLAGNISLYLRRTPTSTLEVIATNITNTGSRVWTVTGPVTSTARILVRNVACIVADSSSSTFSIFQPPKITVTSPNGAELWQGGTIHNVTWTALSISGTVVVQINRSYPSGTWETLQSGVSASGSYPWTVSGSGSTNRIRVVWSSNSMICDTSNAIFSIPSIVLTSPNGGENLTIGSTRTITWTSSLVSGTLNIYLRRSNSTTWTRICPNVANTGSARWVVTSPITSTAKILIQNAAATIKDSSNAVFSIGVTGSPDTPTTPIGTSENPTASIPIAFQLSAAPNPFNPSTTISFSLPHESVVSLTIFDARGAEVQRLVPPTNYRAGKYSVRFDGSRLSGGVYYYRLTNGSETTVKKIVLVK